jgi:hypothetical protein
MALRRSLIQFQCVVVNCNNISRSRARHVSSVQLPSDWSPQTCSRRWRRLERSHPFSTDASSDNDDTTLNESKLWDGQWHANYEKLKELIEQHRQKESNVPFFEFGFCPDKKVASWLDRQRYLYRQKKEGKENSLTDDREQQLLDLGITMKPWDRHWMQRYEKLCKFVKERACFPHECEKESLSKEDSVLVVWCNKQRQQYQIYKKGKQGQFTSMTPEREHKLAAIGFCFDLFEEVWMERYGELKEYRNHNGDCLVPHVYESNLQLGVWVGDQRYCYKKFREGRPSSMAPERVDLLNKLGFVWFVPHLIWSEKYRLLEEHVRINGLGSLPPWKDSNNLRSWAANQQKLYRNRMQGANNTMTQERIKKLDRLGFPWSV